MLERVEQEGNRYYRWRGVAELSEDIPPERFLKVENSRDVRIELDCVSLDALARLNEVADLEITAGILRAAPSLLKISHAAAGTLEGPVFGWLRANHPAFGTAVETVERRRGNLIVHENLLVAKVSDAALKVKLEREFGAAGQLVGLGSGHVAFPTGMLPRLQGWMKRSGHVIKSVSSHEPD